jgi:hypothetical protein
MKAAERHGSSTQFISAVNSNRDIVSEAKKGGLFVTFERNVRELETYSKKSGVKALSGRICDP